MTTHNGAADTARVLIVGAGPTGLVLALRLARHGVPFRIIDKNRGPGLASCAMAVHARTLEFYDQLGFADEVVAAGIKMGRIHVRKGGKEFALLSLAAMGEGLSRYPYMLCYPQDDHERLLVEKLKAAGIEVEWGVELAEFSQSEAHARAVLVRDGAREVVDVAYLCGCDGGHSRVREGLGLGFPGGTYANLFFVSDVAIGGITDAEAFMNLGADSFSLLLPVRSSGNWRIIGVVPEALSGRADLTFEDVRAPVERLLDVRVERVNWFSTYHVHHRVAAHFRSGRALLAGDAGHVHSPAGGQGMNTGIGDAVNLSWKLADVLAGRAHPSLLDTYEEERIAFARTLVATTDRVFQGVAGRGVGNRILRTWLIPALLPVVGRSPVVRRAIFKTISQIRIRYPRSPLSAGKAGDVSGGDRLPWTGGDGANNHEPLRSLAWQLHVYGVPDPRLAEFADSLGLPLHAFPWNDAAGRAGLQRDAAYLVRPDGHVALASPTQDPQALRNYTGRLGLSFREADRCVADEGKIERH